MRDRTYHKIHRLPIAPFVPIGGDLLGGLAAAVKDSRGFFFSQEVPMTHHKNAPRYGAAHPPPKRRELRALVPLVRERFKGAAIYIGADHLLVECEGRMYRVTSAARGAAS